MLTVYRASAGAGKTHKLTGEYLKLLFNRDAAYRRILAVTFTNKATDEMKSRIIHELYHLASEKQSGYIDMLMEKYTLNEQQIRKKARTILITILHDYAAFNISTIDRFFQQTMRAFTREIGLQGGYNIEMDQELVLTEAVDNLLADLDKPENKELLGWLLRFAEDKIENGGEWNLRRDIMSLSREVFKESYKASSEQVSKDIEDKQELESFKNELYNIIRSVENELKKLGEKGVSILQQYALQPTDFKGGSNSPLKHFERYARGETKEPTATFMNLADNVDVWYAKTTPPGLVQIIQCAFEDGLNDCVKGVVALFANLKTYYTAKEIVRFYYTLGILNDISRQIAAYREEKNIMLIADTTELLNKVIDGSHTPFIYERTGTHVDHYMIDEFQDTSNMQWNNFRPLIEESLAHNYNNLIVGDVKQSIYRFRNSDWKLLDEQVQKDFSPAQVNEQTLKDNWRSFRHIVEFNNTFFQTAPSLLQLIYNEALDTSSLNEEDKGLFSTKIATVYADSAQLIPPKFQKKDGHVKIDFLSGDEETDWKEEALQRLPAVLEQLQDNDYSLKDIAILTRTNLEGASVADFLLTYKEEHPSEHYHYDIISDEALFVSSSPAVRFMIALLRHLKSPDNLTNKQMALFNYAILSGKSLNIGSQNEFPSDIQKELDILSRLSLYELTEGLFRLFSNYFAADEQAYVQAFFDMVSEYAQKESADLSRFLSWWDDAGYKKSIATPDGQNAIRILTIHKSKGLGFPVVIMPFGDWEIDHKPTKQVIIWCQPQEAPFNKLHLLPVRYGQALSKTIFAKDYFQERLHACIDNLNTLYVAFTRAKEELIVFAPRPKKISEKSGAVEKISSITDLLWASLHESFSFDTTNGCFESGSPCKSATEKKAELLPEELSLGKLYSVSPDERLQLRLHGKGFFFDNSQRKHGALMHDILSAIRTSKDISPAVESYRQAGVINREESNELLLRLEKLLSNPEVESWYNGSAHVLNEVDILSGKNITRRPDRVMITPEKVTVVDYKFGEQQDKRHHYQVKNYMKLIREMGYTHVEGCLWYVELEKIEVVYS
ncbi:ATP-dependent helicase/nuclease subunit A [Parabacteroides sp. PF5-5]|uniref:UvrD-helicase domain-containing protein n=1 Tax=unclassified Parabacteroides TaxID=2649774 RepID=UPI002473E46C|nr:MULTISPECIES: UvrD-helicase domain-containing protein [unclassified Parabacteroides]MDH6306294.1 ATP-dependent helicase/nuclease subunit A [Parabacteroides sp. PH5-39]MDH6316915.1 ATP-dependent helicase/nuclease subunit A [Parabacteroides sp. PF5-13]MDH6320984.1 ATP-dependent helicase/nuclease subunit A [Parabacteroides sp. PH5-13]MDH6324716.1 ATP-dependent helicase/nuclease subunit A [Parabacteroides sp. PH5-8]MDH6328100.1 ATP-dependent helicase/nuclease subunit A [Parabacteroides sp. PH5-